jgi:murein DD-endopeptidase MepM/ murein hydrolase activator NlpD
MDYSDPEKLMTGEVAPLDESGSPAQDLQKAENDAADEGAENSASVKDDDAVNKNESAPNSGWDYGSEDGKGGKSSMQGGQKKNFFNKYVFGSILGIFGGSGMVMLLTAILGGWAILAMLGGFLEKTYMVTDSLVAARSVKNAMKMSQYDGVGKNGTKTLNQRLGKSRVGKITTLSGEKMLAKQYAKGLDFDLTLNGRDAIAGKMDLKKLYPNQSADFWRNTDPDKLADMVEKRLGIRPTSIVDGTFDFPKDLMKDRQALTKFMKSLDGEMKNWFTKTQQFFRIRAALSRVGIYHSLSFWKNLRSAANIKADTAGKKIARAVSNKMSEALEKVEKLKVVRSAFNKVRSAAPRLRKISLSVGLGELFLAAACVVKGLQEMASPSGRFASTAVPAMNESATLINAKDTMNAGDMGSEEIAASLMTYAYNEYETDPPRNDTDSDEFDSNEKILVQSSSLDVPAYIAEAGGNPQALKPDDPAYETTLALQNMQKKDTGVGATILRAVNRVATWVATDVTCSEEFLGIVGIASMILDVVATFATSGAGAAIKTAIVSGVILGVGQLVSNLIPADDSEDAEQEPQPKVNFTNAIYGTIFNYNESVMAMGASKLGKDVWIGQETEWKEQLAAEYAKKPWYEKVFDGTDHRSVVSSMGRALNLDLSNNSITSGIKNVGRVAASLPQIFARIFSPSYSLQAASAGTYDYGVDRWGFSDEFNRTALKNNMENTSEIETWSHPNLQDAREEFLKKDEDGNLINELNEDGEKISNDFEYCYGKKLDPVSFNLIPGGTGTGLQFVSSCDNVLDSNQFYWNLLKFYAPGLSNDYDDNLSLLMDRFLVDDGAGGFRLTTAADFSVNRGITGEEINHNLKVCYRKEIDLEDFNLKNIDPDTSSRYYDIDGVGGHSTLKGLGASSSCDNESNVWWGRMKLYMLDLFDLSSNSCQDETEFCDSIAEELVTQGSSDEDYTPTVLDGLAFPLKIDGEVASLTNSGWTAETSYHAKVCPGYYAFDLMITDSMAKDGTDVLAVHDGIVKKVNQGGSSDMGASVQIFDEENHILYYETHMADGSIIVRAGQKVTAGEKIGVVSTVAENPGVNAPHLHVDANTSDYRPNVAASKGICIPSDFKSNYQFIKELGPDLFNLYQTIVAGS